MEARKRVEECYCLMYEGMVNKDEDLLQEVLDPSFVLVHMTGMRQSRSEFIRAVLPGISVLILQSERKKRNCAGGV